MRALSVIMVLSLCACASTRSVSTDNGFVIGQTYTTNTTLFAIHWGDRAELVSHYRASGAKSRPKNVRAIPTGTHLVVVAIRSDNTLTRGLDEWPEAKILTGELTGSMVSVNAPNLIEHVTLIKP
ncbi:MAG: hypothetical protein AB8B96_01900 [Lysobacterales bacterium]